MDVAEEKIDRAVLQHDAGAEPRGTSFSQSTVGILGTDRSAIGASWADFEVRPDHKFEDQVRSNERDRIARELHDSTSQLLVVLELQLMRLKRFPDVMNHDEIIAEMDATLDELHEQVRAVGATQHLKPAALGEKLRAIAMSLAGQTGLTVRTEVEEVPANMSQDVADALYRIGQEALANASRHSNGKEVRLRLGVSANGKWVALRVSDDGVGFSLPPRPAGGRGLANIRARVEELQGKLKIRNHTHGASVEVKLAVDQQAYCARPAPARLAMAR
jgi:signal transduction histidine kinase